MFSNIRRVLFLFLILILTGTSGYMLIENYKFTEALFMTVITITTVGYGTIRELSDIGIIFTIILIVTSFVLVGFAVQNLSKYITEGDFRKDLKQRKFNRMIKNTKNHVIVCGYGLNGSHAVQELINSDETVVVIDQYFKNADSVSSQNPKIIFITGDARDEHVLLQAKIREAKALIAALKIDADNLFVVLTARELNPNLKIISRAVDDSSDHKLKRAGADYVILPDSVGGIRMAKLVSEPDVIEFLENIMAKSGIDVNLTQIECNDLPYKFLGRSLSELNIRRKSGANIIGMKLQDGTYIFNPGGDYKLEKKSKLFILGTPQQIDVLKQMLLEK